MNFFSFLILFTAFNALFDFSFSQSTSTALQVSNPPDQDQMRLYVFLNATSTPFNQKCVQRFLPNRNCFCLLGSFGGGYSANIGYKHLSFIMYYNIIERIPSYSINAKLNSIFTQSNDIFEKYQKGQLTMSPEKEKIPRIMHKVWITHHENPFNIPENLWDMIRDFLNELGDVHVYIWVMDQELIRPSLGAIKRINPEKIIIKRTKELIDSMTPRMKEFFYFLYDGNRFAKASDVIRFYALQKYGGVFTDLDMTIKKDFMFTLNHDLTVFIFNQPFAYLTEMYFIAAVPNHPAFEQCFRLWENRGSYYDGPLRIVRDLDIHWQQLFTYFWTISVLNSTFNTPGLSTLIYNRETEKKIINHKSDLSWQSKKYGNIKESPKMFDFQWFDQYMSTLVRPNGIPVDH